ncbi:hypothetical protein YPCD1.07 (plasmid) [Yersinia pestis biovar Medievalis str. Harbin 35]|uniref:Uncharacterized protein n=2 Tax=Yersinia pestis TaxID=632 RepID=Q7ARJ9_YERPE|nr:unknown [Yersinia pestis]AAS58591.1 hypothetical protein YP_pCD80 [Yersinia pestis biovar Microtus str. 91001]ABR14799.1 hypothetical protein YPCD1.07 [Yersinia pestis CA88-4125]ADW01042.1 hypothetical protein YPCD1.07 [Yersinia pestis biovar Medievalis str. Harbin 35]EEO78771.1 hypothetical protein YPF_4696 [Yersinia pestis biovar Orientalis str. India 195]EEO88229.1 hypothetical protein YPS_4763 [Yersinia pestis Pestoides A]CAB54884.1 hypothetical protein YPCD1.07 [Yersinia pestis CO92]
MDKNKGIVFPPFSINIANIFVPDLSGANRFLACSLLEFLTYLSSVLLLMLWKILNIYIYGLMQHSRNQNIIAKRYIVYTVLFILKTANIRANPVTLSP